MHILYYHQHFCTPKGCCGTRSYEMSVRLIKEGHKVTIVCGSSQIGNTGLDGNFKYGQRKGIVNGINVIELSLPYSNKDNFFKRSITFIRYALRSIFIALTIKYDLIFATSTPLTASIPGIIARIFRKKTFIFEVRDLWPELPEKMGVIKNPIILKMLDILELFSYRFANHIIGLSPGIVDGVAKRGIHNSKITMIPNGSDNDLFDSNEKFCINSYQNFVYNINKGSNLNYYQDVFFLNNKHFIAIFTGAHGIANGLNSVLDAAIELKKRKRNDILIVFIGEGKLKPELIKKSKEYDLNNCLFLDPVPKVYLVNILKNADIGLMILANIEAFYFSTSPNKFFDYLAAGIPVLNNYPGWLSQLINEYNCGISVLPDNSHLFANALEYAADNKEEMEKMGLNAKKLALEKFDRNILAKKFVNTLVNYSQL